MTPDVKKQSLKIGAYNIELIIPLNQKEDSEERISFWYEVTSAAIALSNHLEAHYDLFEKKVLELGCGLGLAGITAGKLGAKITFTDYKEDALRYAKINSENNKIIKANFKLLDWEKPENLEKYDLIIGSEIAYDYFFHDSLSVILKSARKDTGEILLADRRRLVIDRFIGQFIHDGYSANETKLFVDSDNLSSKEISIFCLKTQASVFSG